MTVKENNVAARVRRLLRPRRERTTKRIKVIAQSDQITVFTNEPIPDAELLDRQGIAGPQGLDTLADPEWNPKTDDAYLAALTGG